MQATRKAMAAVVLGAALVATPGWAAADTTVQNQNTSENSFAKSGDVEASNNAEVNQGPQANSHNGVASAQQNGDNSGEVKQDSQTSSGHAVAGSQVTGVSGGSGNTTVQNQNNSKNAIAVSGNVKATNTASVEQGPQANALFGVALAQQNGSNSGGIDQKTQAESGDAVSGSQVTGIV